MTWQATLVAAQATREILLSIALLVGGIWALFRYRKLERTEAQLERKRQEALIGLSSYLNISIVTTVRQDGDAFDILGDVRIHNPGTAGLKCNLNEVPPVRIARLELNDEGDYVVSAEARTLGFLATEEIGWCILESEGEASLKFVARVDGPALYLVEFWSRIGIDTSVVDFPSTSWMSNTIVEVSPEAAAARAVPAPAAPQAIAKKD